MGKHLKCSYQCVNRMSPFKWCNHKTRGPLQSPSPGSCRGSGQRPPIARTRFCNVSESARQWLGSANISVTCSKFVIKLVVVARIYFMYKEYKDAMLRFSEFWCLGERNYHCFRDKQPLKINQLVFCHHGPLKASQLVVLWVSRH